MESFARQLLLIWVLLCLPLCSNGAVRGQTKLFKLLQRSFQSGTLPLPGRNGKESLARRALNSFVQQSHHLAPPGSVCLDWDFRYINAFKNCKQRWNLVYAPGNPRVDAATKHIYGPLDTTAASFPQSIAGMFDVIVCTQVFEHISNPLNAVAVLHRLLKPGGHVIFSAPFTESYHEFPHDNYRYTAQGAAMLFQQQGFHVVRQAVGGNTFMAVIQMLGFVADDLDAGLELVANVTSEPAYYFGAYGVFRKL